LLQAAEHDFNSGLPKPPKSIRSEMTQTILVLQNLVSGRKFNLTITGIILLQALVLALETFSEFSRFKNIFEVIHWSVVGSFIVEAGLKFASLYPRPQVYFKDSWNAFDFAIIVLSLIPFTGSFSTVARIVRLLRVTRLANKSKEMRIMISTIAKSLPSMLNILLLLGILFFIYGIAGYHLFSQIDSEHWGSLQDSLLTLFKIITLEEWVEIMRPALDANTFNAVFFISFIVVGTFIVINLFVAIIVKKTEEAHIQIQTQSMSTPSQKEILIEIRQIKQMIENLEQKIGFVEKLGKNPS
jgi:voltage-gated sodium channel